MLRILIMFFVIYSSSYTVLHSQDLNKNLLLHYKFDNNANDASVNNFDGNPVNVMAVDDRNGNMNSAYHFDGTAYVDMPFEKRLHPQMPVSFSFWFKLNNYNNPIVAFFDSDFSINKYSGFFCSIVTTGKKIGMGFGDTGKIGRDSRRARRGLTSIKLDIWYHVVLVYKAVDDLDIYLNGCPDGNNYSGNGNTTVKYLGNHGTIGRVDANATPGPIDHLQGSLDEFCMWDRVLTQEDVTKLYDGKNYKDISLGPDKEVCIFENITLDPGSGYKSFLWQDGSRGQAFFVSNEGLYWVEVEDHCGNITRDSVEFKIKKPPPLPPISDTTICYGQEIIFTIDNNDFHYFEWSSDGGFECKDCPTISDFPEQSSTYILSAQTIDGCERFDTFYVEVIYPLHTFDTISICKGDTILVFGQFVWMEDDFQNLFTTSNGCASTYHIHVKELTGQFMESNITICPGDSALIFGQWRNTRGEFIQKFDINSICDSISLIKLNLSPEITGSIPLEYYICQVQDKIEINADFSGGSGKLSYLWDNNLGRSTISLGIGKHELLVEDEMGCSLLLIFEIFLLDKPDYTLDHTDLLCFGLNDGTISINQLNSNRQWKYSLDDLSFSQQPPYLGLKSSQYILYARDSFGCLYSDTINIISPDSLTLTISKDTTIILGNSVVLFSNGNYHSSDVNYVWTPSDGLSCTDCPNPIARPFKTTTYTHTITDKNGCPVTRELTIFVKIDVKVYIPNVFSPNGDGINDAFTVFTNVNVKEIDYLEIYDRWGELVFRKQHFEPNDPKLGWDGKLNGEEMNPAVFVYVAGVRLLDDSIHSYLGDITLLSK